MRIFKNSSFALGAILLLSVFSTTGCAVRTYSVYKERSDLDLNSGNRGFLAGESNEPAEVAKTTRESKVIEVEVFPLIKSLRRSRMKPAGKEAVNAENAGGAEGESQHQVVSGEASDAREYKVQPNDTLQKISQMFYGTMHKWNKIYEANKDRLKGPDKIKPGQLLRIPADTKPQPVSARKSEEAKEPMENLK
ncbi:MAG: LysM peptidoglycan-binding domain-containing protein [Candidatus Omnitrophota bacterium]